MRNFSIASREAHQQLGKIKKMKLQAEKSCACARTCIEKRSQIAHVLGPAEAELHVSTHSETRVAGVCGTGGTPEAPRLCYGQRSSPTK